MGMYDVMQGCNFFIFTYQYSLCGRLSAQWKVLKHYVNVWKMIYWLVCNKVQNLGMSQSIAPQKEWKLVNLLQSYLMWKWMLIEPYPGGQKPDVIGFFMHYEKGKEI